MKKLLFLLPLIFAAATAASADSAAQRGAVCFTFDDHHGKNRIAADKIFKKYDAHATCQIVRKITAAKAGAMKTLQAVRSAK